jgi:dihydrofolate synthase/folylpolyglutamate synthase
MSYAAAIYRLNALVPELHTVPGQTRRKFSLDEMRILLGALGNPQHQFPALLIAGTNGKGSTASTLASILKASGVRAGLYTSPHLERVNERVCVDGAEIGDDAFARLYFKVEEAAQQLVREGRLPQFPSFFEILTAQALLYFAEVGAQIAVLEVGMGGRLDATNVVDPLLSIITDISLDHTEWLGSTISAIAKEKAGVLRRQGTLIALPQHTEANAVLAEVAGELDVREVDALQYLPPSRMHMHGAYSLRVMGTEIEVDSPLAGVHQFRNVALAIAAAVELAQKHQFPVTSASIAAGIRETRWPGRLERIAEGSVEWILDVAHNPAGAWALRAGLVELSDMLEGKLPRTLVFSCLRDKPVAEMAQILFPLFDQILCAPIRTARATSIEDLLAAGRAAGITAIPTGSVAEALQLAKEKTPQGVIVVSGSVYLVGEARSLLLQEQGGKQ